MDEQKEEVKEAPTYTIRGWHIALIVAFAGVGFIFTVLIAGIIARNHYDAWYKVPQNRMQELFNCANSHHCVIKDSPGGDPVLFRAAAFSLGPGDLVQIKGYCLSACATFADIARPYVCVTADTQMGFHMGVQWIDDDVKRYFFPGLAKDITLWVYAHGNFPNTDEGQDWLYMKYPETLKFWVLCPTEEVGRRGDKLQITHDALTLPPSFSKPRKRTAK